MEVQNEETGNQIAEVAVRKTGQPTDPSSTLESEIMVEMPSCVPKPEIETTIQFIGGAGHHFSSFEEQCTHYLDIFCPKLNIYDAKSYILPPTFTYRWQFVSDQDFEIYYKKNQEPLKDREKIKKDQKSGEIKESRDAAKSKSNPKQDDLIVARISEEAEHVVYRSVCKLIEKNVQAPFIAIHGFTLDDKRLKLLRSIFPNVPWMEDHKHEYDMLLIGAKIGVIVVEVKSSKFVGKEDFANGNRHLPEEYKKGLTQLKSIEALLDILDQCIPQEERLGFRIPKSNVTKIIFTPNLTRERYENWRKTAGVDCATTTGVIQLFEEDVFDRSIDTKLKEILESQSVDSKFQSTLKYYGQLLAGISASVLSIIDQSSKEVSLKASNFSKDLAAQKTSRIIAQQCTGPERTELQNSYHQASQLKKSTQIKSKNGSVLFLTPEQVKVMTGKNRQIIVGAAGTGKTMLLQEKALELLKKGKQIIVVAPNMFKIKYAQLFEKNLFKNPENYQLCNWSEFSDLIFVDPKIRQLTEALPGNVFSGILELRKIFVDCILEMPNEVLQQICKNACGDELLNKSDLELRKFILEKEREGCIEKSLSIFQSVLHWRIAKLINENNAFCNHIRKTLSTHHILIDDALAEIYKDEMACLTLLAVLVIPAQPQTTTDSKCEELTVWIAFDPVQFGNSDSKMVTELVSTLNCCASFSRTKLNRVMRCSAEILTCINENTKKLFGMAGLDLPTIGHKVQGVKPTDKGGFFFTNKEACEALKRELSESVFQFLNENTPSSYIGIVLGGDFAKVSIVKEIVRSLQDKYRRHKVGTMSSYQEDQNVSIVVACHDEIFSYEWPVVIYAPWGPLRGPFAGMRMYFASSRAMACFISLDFIKVYVSANYLSVDKVIRIKTETGRIKEDERKQLGKRLGHFCGKLGYLSCVRLVYLTVWPVLRLQAILALMIKKPDPNFFGRLKCLDEYGR